MEGGRGRRKAGGTRGRCKREARRGAREVGRGKEYTEF
jgi:hypothetical protein